MAPLSLLRQLVFLFTFCCLVAPTSPKQAVWRRVEALNGGEAVLPCHVARAEAGDRVYVVLWYRDNGVEPVYSYDNRPGRVVGPEQRHTLRSRQLEGRATFRPGVLPALHINPVRIEDQANYTCRADFRIASSRRTHLTLVVVVPPETPQLRVGGELWPTGGLLGALQEGAALEVTCTVVGGVPRPAVVWRRNDEILQVSREPLVGTSGVLVSRLAVSRLTRQYHNARLSCQAYNNNVTEPLEASVTLAMNLRPLLTRLVSPPASMRVGRRYAITCLAAGSRPHPNVTWTLSDGAATVYLSAEVSVTVCVSSKEGLP
ncbi:kin of IRRE-like protein 2 [Eriocheir sinensis]|uniref:kin of IRRE-like protein 2 n=1 Tax=Eriocheir sinensis TaxID=95602 RepID=UPI0021C8C03B|nr:kin of IRRE-like protein 2 [Eriocheir sinensis]